MDAANDGNADQKKRNKKGLVFHGNILFFTFSIESCYFFLASKRSFQFQIFSRLLKEVNNIVLQFNEKSNGRIK